MNQVWGIDIGNVIIDSRNLDSKIEKVDEVVYATFPPTEGVFEAIKIINDKFSGRVYLISKCSEWAKTQIQLWLENHNFYSRTGVSKEKVYFVQERKDKDIICRKLGVTNFVDDRLEVLSYMIESTPNLFLFDPNQEETDQFKDFLPKVTVVKTWKDIIDLI